jgi:hypothetical protein
LKTGCNQNAVMVVHRLVDTGEAGAKSDLAIYHHQSKG